MNDHSSSPDERLTVRCACGWEITGYEADVVSATQEHGLRVHNMSATREQVLAMGVPVETSPTDPGLGRPAG
jgi:hypothetical protein